MPRWPALCNRICGSHLSLVKDGNSPGDLESKTLKQRDAANVGRADPGHKRHFPHAAGRGTRALQEVGEERRAYVCSLRRGEGGG